jgi:hypothetical protein
MFKNFTVFKLRIEARRNLVGSKKVLTEASSDRQYREKENKREDP